jgi:hypothetical protein
MKQKNTEIFQFKVTLKGIRPPIWRRIQVLGSCTFWDLHVAIQDAMGWFDCHLHEFSVFSPSAKRVERIGIPSDLAPAIAPILPGWELRIDRYFSAGNPRADYYYDFGDDWRHSVALEKVLRREPSVSYPRCVAGRRACPPESCGGTWGYEELVRKLADPSHPEHGELLEWLDRPFDPNRFDPNDVVFENPRQRWLAAVATLAPDPDPGSGRAN